MEWKSSSVIKILKNEKYVGDLVQKKTYTPDFLTHDKRYNKGAVPLITIKDHHVPIIHRDIWNAAQERLRRNNKRGEGDGGHSNRYVFSGKIKCGECGSSFVGRFKYLKDGIKIRRWCCSTVIHEGKKGCNVGKLIRDDDATQMLKTAIRSLPIDSDGIISAVTDLALEAIQAEKAMLKFHPQRIQKEIERVQQKKEAAMDSYFSREIKKEDMRTMIRKYEQELHVLRCEMEDAIRIQEQNQDFSTLRRKIQMQVTSILSGEMESEVFYKNMLSSMTVFKDRHIVVKLNNLVRSFWFVG